MPRLPHNRYNKNFSQKIGFITFIKLLNPNFMQKIRKKKIQSWENSATDRRKDRVKFIRLSNRDGGPTKL